ncbi:MAG: hypothetical protein IKM01_04790 [Clostridia bacterium]|nr:hypothetical protein [Clostridia bacterium]
MKNFITITATILVLTLALLSLTSCVKMPRDYKDARTNLKDNDYGVQGSSTPEESFILVTLVLEGMASSIKDQNSRLNALTLVDIIKSHSQEILADIKNVIVGLSNDGKGEDFVLLIYFKDKEAVERNNYYFTSLFMVLQKNEIDYDTIPIYSDALIYGDANDVLYLGTKQGLKDTN